MKRGRPLKADGRTKQVRVRLTEKEYETLRRMSEETGKSLSDILRNILVSKG